MWGLRRWGAPAALLAVAGLSAAGLVVDTDDARRHDGPDPGAPVLSPRRAPGLLTRPAADSALAEDLAAIVADGPEAQCLVVEVGGRPLISHQPDRSLIPASTMKVVVASAALIELGPEHPVGRNGEPLDEVVAELLTESNNDAAEMLLLELGRERGDGSSSTAGREVVERLLVEQRVPVEGVEVADGSGLSRANRLTCTALMDLLDLDAGRNDLAQAFAVLGRTGTLSDRGLGTSAAGKVRAKTGSLYGVVALTGIAETRTGERARFAYIMNGVANRAGEALQDRLMTSLTAHAPAHLGAIAPEGAS